MATAKRVERVTRYENGKETVERMDENGNIVEKVTRMTDGSPIQASGGRAKKEGTHVGKMSPETEFSVELSEDGKSLVIDAEGSNGKKSAPFELVQKAFTELSEGVVECKRDIKTGRPYIFYGRANDGEEWTAFAKEEQRKYIYANYCLAAVRKGMIDGDAEAFVKNVYEQ